MVAGSSEDLSGEHELTERLGNDSETALAADTGPPTESGGPTASQVGTNKLLPIVSKTLLEMTNVSTS